VEVINTKKTVNTKLITGEPERQPLQEFFEKINTEISKQKEKAGQARMK
jgi:hypothetical protein